MSPEAMAAALFGQDPEIPNDELPTINRPATILGVSITFQVLAWLAVCFRVFARLYLAHSPGWDDFFVVLASIAATAGTVVLCIQPEQGGLGQPMFSQSLETITTYLQLLYASNAIYLASTTFIKVSILFQYLRLFPRDRHAKLHRFIIILICLVGAWGTTFTFTQLFGCTPVNEFWNIAGTLSDSSTGTCVMFGSKNMNHFFAAFAGHAASNMILDVLILAIPIPYWKEIARNKRSKMALIGLLAVGVVVASISIARLVTMVEHRAGTSPKLDLTYYGPPIFITSVLEVQVAVFAASMPIFWPIIESLGMGKILVVNEVSVRTDAPSRATHPDHFSDSDDTELRRLHSKEGAIAGWQDPSGETDSDTKHAHNPHFSTHCMSVDPPIQLRPMNYYSPPANRGPPPPRKP